MSAFWHGFHFSFYVKMKPLCLSDLSINEIWEKTENCEFFQVINSNILDSILHLKFIKNFAGQ